MKAEYKIVGILRDGADLRGRVIQFQLNEFGDDGKQEDGDALVFGILDFEQSRADRAHIPVDQILFAIGVIEGSERQRALPAAQRRKECNHLGSVDLPGH